MGVGIILLRHKRAHLGLPKPSFRVWNIILGFNILVTLYTLVMPWYPPEGGATGGDVSFWYATYVVVSIGILIACGLYYLVWIIFLPRWQGYAIRQELILLDGGAQTHSLIKVPLDDVADWDHTHDVNGAKLERDGGSSSEERIDINISADAKA
jgi:hypothetical protein